MWLVSHVGDISFVALIGSECRISFAVQVIHDEFGYTYMDTSAVTV
jgi:hypothetical protein